VTKFLMKTAKSSVLALVALPLMAAGAAQAEDARIKTADLDLSKTAQVAVLDARIERAANSFCRDVFAQDLARRNACRAAFKAEAMDQLKPLHRQEEARTAKPANGVG
jgi:UrcA family protein